MPKLQHQALVEMFRDCPGLSVELLRRVGFSVPRGLRFRGVDADLSTTKSVERRADVMHIAKRGQRAELAIVTEVQLSRDPGKLQAWPTYALLAGSSHRCRCVVLVIAPSKKVANWARRVRELQPGLAYAPLVIGPGELPPIRSVAEARRHIELAVLTALAYAHEPVKAAKPVVERVVKACGRLPGDVGLIYWDIIREALRPALKEAIMLSIEGYKFRSDFAKKHQAIGHAEGRAEGKLEGLRQAIRGALRARKLKLTATADKRIERETDLKTLRKWLMRAVTVEKVSAIFDG